MIDRLDRVRVTKIAAIVGGFHLGGPAFESIIAPTLDALAEMDPASVVPAHCSGWRAGHALAAKLHDAYVPNSVGSRLELSSEPTLT